MVSGGLGIDPGFWSGRRVFLTGHTGFKGAWLTLWLERMGATIHGYALAPERAHDLFAAAGIGGLCQSTIADIRDHERLAAALREFRPQIVLHLAAQSLVRRSYAKPVETFAVNVMGTAHLLDACRDQAELEAIVVVTTDKVYANPETGDAFAEDDPLGGSEPYGLSKAAAELAAQAWRGAFFAGGPGVATARAGNVVGGGDWSEDRLIPDAMRAFTSGDTLIVRNPDAVRPWQHVIEPLAGYLGLAARLAGGGQEWARAWNFGPSATQFYKVAEVVERVAAAWGHGATWRATSRADAPHEATLLTLDSSRATERLGWRPALDLERALALTVDWYRRWADDAGPLALQALMADQLAAVAGVGG